MTLEAPVLDDRTHQQFVDELRKRIPLYCPEWTDHNLSDPGITLIELFAHMAELLIYRMNRVPELHYIKFMEFLGINLQPPNPAKTRVTFRLSEPQATRVSIPIGTEVSTTQTETVRPIIFSTDDNFDIYPPELLRVATLRKNGTAEIIDKDWDIEALVKGVDYVDLFSEEPQNGDAFYFGFKNNLSHHLLRMELDFDPIQGIGIRTEKPPRSWEYWSTQENRWMPIEQDGLADETKGMNVRGRIELHLPHLVQTTIADESLYWLRVVAKQPTLEEERRAGVRGYKRSPRLLQIIEVASIGGTVPATNATVIRNETLGQSNGTAGQRFRLSRAPVLGRRLEKNEVLYVDDKAWIEVEHFANSGAEDTHYMLDSATGEIRLGPAVPEPDGTIRRYGAVPPLGANLVFRQYRFGGGVQANVLKRQINRLKTSIPFVNSVENLIAATGGQNKEELQSAMLRTQRFLRSRFHAITVSDYENLILESYSNHIARVYCLGAEVAGSGRVRIVVVPHPATRDKAGKLTSESLRLNESLRREIESFINDRRLLTTVQVQIVSPRYRWVSVRVELSVISDIEQQLIRDLVLQRLYEFINPITGGWDRSGWTLGTTLTPSDIELCINQLLRDNQFVAKCERVELLVTEQDGQTATLTVPEVKLEAYGVIVSNEHVVLFR